jgi:hypothetical protein
MTREASQLVLGGKTYDVKDAIKALGGHWNPARRVWTLPLHLDTDETRARLGALSRNEQEVLDFATAAAFAAAEEMMAKQRAKAALKAAKLRAAEKLRVQECVASGNYPWICCDKCEVIDWDNRHTSCLAHAHWDGQSWCCFRVNGTLYTGT